MGDISGAIFRGLWHTSGGRGNSLTQIITNVLEDSHLLITSGIWRPPLVLVPALLPRPQGSNPVGCPKIYPFLVCVHLHLHSHVTIRPPQGHKINLTVLKIINLVEGEGLPVTCTVDHSISSLLSL